MNETPAGLSVAGNCSLGIEQRKALFAESFLKNDYTSDKRVKGFFVSNKAVVIYWNVTFLFDKAKIDHVLSEKLLIICLRSL